MYKEILKVQSEGINHIQSLKQQKPNMEIAATGDDKYAREWPLNGL